MDVKGSRCKFNIDYDTHDGLGANTRPWADTIQTTSLMINYLAAVEL